MISGLDHVVLLTSESEAGDYLKLLGQDVHGQYDTGDGRRVRIAQVSNTSLEIMSPLDAGPGADRLSDLMANGTRIASLAFASDDLAREHRAAERRGLNPSEIGEGHNASFYRCDDAICAGVKTFIVQPREPRSILSAEPDQVARLDHLVINTPNPERALAHYGARLGLRLAMDRPMPDFGARMVFFKAGDVTIEVIHRMDEDHVPDAQDTLWGLSWEVPSIAAAHTRLTRQNIEVSEIRTGRKPGTDVFTVKSHNFNIPTLFIGQSAG